MACEPQTVLDDSKCFRCASEKQLLAMQAYSAWQAWKVLDPRGAPATVQALLDDSSCLRCGTSHKALLAAIAYSLCEIGQLTP